MMTTITARTRAAMAMARVSMIDLQVQAGRSRCSGQRNRGRRPGPVGRCQALPPGVGARTSLAAALAMKGDRIRLGASVRPATLALCRRQVRLGVDVHAGSDVAARDVDDGGTQRR